MGKMLKERNFTDEEIVILHAIQRQPGWNKGSVTPLSEVTLLASGFWQPDVNDQIVISARYCKGLSEKSDWTVQLPLREKDISVMRVVPFYVSEWKILVPYTMSNKITKYYPELARKHV